MQGGDLAREISTGYLCALPSLSSGDVALGGASNCLEILSWQNDTEGAVHACLGFLGTLIVSVPVPSSEGLVRAGLA